MKILLSAYACEPHKGSEPELGWNWVKQVSKNHRVWVITRANNKEVVERETKKNPLSNVQFCYFDLPHWLRFWKKGRRGYHLYYYLWQIGIYFYARKLHSKYEFDLAHHITFGNNWMPSFVSLLPVPFIWGPVGSEDMPRSLISELMLKEKIYEFFRLLIRRWGHYFDPFVRLTIKRARLILDCSSKWAKKVIPHKYHSKIIKMSQNGIKSVEQPKKNWSVEAENFTVMTVARLIHWKGIRLAAKAFISLNNNLHDANMIIVGEGPEYNNLVDLFDKNNLSDKVIFTGKLSKNDFLNTLPKGDVFLYPSFHHGQATVVLQAMAAGLPVICIKGDTVGETVSNECGIRIKIESPEQIVIDLAKGLEKLAKDSALRRQMGENAQKRIEEIYDWDRKGEKIDHIYRKIFHPQENE